MGWREALWDRFVTAAPRSSRRGATGSSPLARAHLPSSKTAIAGFAQTLEKVTVDAVEDGWMTKDLALLVGPDQKWLTTMGYLEKVAEYLDTALD